ncbi:omega-amidase chloroplastic-like [Tripterygium wilfordii]|uniref:Omega-amidase chloroplastic-like n=1 Tax=Tripterygium wilfordii TaxID=458696 RepID=A0A7J7DYA1_TRIWF|nr:omega-amidase, chloroplastic-like isoform X2 [Tripterygium wilfordii]KAF5751241.1 omega-amidase chloroplastic-like [Tripterygium wilfordii]
MQAELAISAMAASSNTILNTTSDAKDTLRSPKFSKFKVAMCQLSVTTDKNINLNHACNSIKMAAEQGAKLVMLPEMWNCSYSTDCFAKYAEDFDDEIASPTFSMLSEIASCHKITIVGGSIPEWSDNRLYNTCCVFGPDGKLKAKHRKMHLFDIDIKGGISFKESNIIAAGEKPTIVDTEVGRIGLGICHDIRFPELAMFYRAKGAHLICYPGAFNLSTGELLWELEQRARAVDNQLYVATCSPSRDSTGDYTIWGHSTLVGPFGEIIATAGHEETILIGEIDYSAIQFQRKNLPLEKHKREDIYQLIDLSQKML